MKAGITAARKTSGLPDNRIHFLQVKSAQLKKVMFFRCGLMDFIMTALSYGNIQIELGIELNGVETL